MTRNPGLLSFCALILASGSVERPQGVLSQDSSHRQEAANGTTLLARKFPLSFPRSGDFVEIRRRVKGHEATRKENGPSGSGHEDQREPGDNRLSRDTFSQLAGPFTGIRTAVTTSTSMWLFHSCRASFLLW